MIVLNVVDPLKPIAMEIILTFWQFHVAISPNAYQICIFLSRV
jgi:hypothetical protein